MKRLNNTLWIEKYRPETLETYIASKTIKDKIQSYIDTNDIPHLLLIGDTGSGKTTFAKLIINNLKCDSLFLNASKENGIDNVRNKISSFASTIGFNDLKIIVLDEADYITLQAQGALRNIMEMYSQHTRFILTGNARERIDKAIISRSQSIELYPPTKKEIAIHLADILEKEEIKYSVDNLKFLIDSFYPDIRKVIGEASSWSTTGTLEVDKKALTETDYKLKVLEILQSKDSIKIKFNSIRQLFADNNVKHFSNMFTLLYDNVEKIAPDKIPECIVVLNEGQYKDALVLDKEINAMSTIINILTLGD